MSDLEKPAREAHGEIEMYVLKYHKALLEVRCTRVSLIIPWGLKRFCKLVSSNNSCENV